MVLVQDQNRELEISVAQVAKPNEEVVQRQKDVEKPERELESAKKNSDAKKLYSDVRRLMSYLEASRVSTAANRRKLQGRLEAKKEELNMLQAQQKSWEVVLTLKDEELGLLNDKVEAQGLTLAELTSHVEALRKELLNYNESDKRRQFFEDVKQAGGRELLALIPF
ncbi:Uncharacterized protein Fot_33595 [Forsythia ovata]|uniref:Uncharacterized protein n=1 Tax=Forsythia ovata TaxID=205694 RepID=A0ABD1TBN6_9LAMI